MSSVDTIAAVEVKACPTCGATVKPNQRECWLCHAKIDAAERGELLKTPPRVPPDESSQGFSLASLLMFVTLVSVTLGLSTIAPGLGIPLGVLLVAVWLRTAAVTRRRAALGLPVSSMEQVQLFFSSLAVTTLLLSLVGVAGFAAFWAACFACLGTYFGLESLGEGVALPAAYVVCGVVCLAILFVALRYPGRWLIRTMTRRWRRDTGQNEEGNSP